MQPNAGQATPATCTVHLAVTLMIWTDVVLTACRPCISIDVGHLLALPRYELIGRVPQVRGRWDRILRLQFLQAWKLLFYEPPSWLVTRGLITNGAKEHARSITEFTGMIYGISVVSRRFTWRRMGKEDVRRSFGGSCWRCSGDNFQDSH